MSRQENSDPLPFVQVDRAIDPTAALLAGHMKVTNQHAIGSLVSFWRLCGDPRELERIVEKTPEGEEPAVILSAEDVAMRFELAAGVRVEPVVLARLGVLEPKASDFRVRGMSRFFEPIERRVHNRRIASSGGAASAEARKKRSGSAQPVGGRGSAVSSVGGSTEPNPEPKRNRTQTEPRTEASTEARPNTEVRDQSAEIISSKEACVPVESEALNLLMQAPPDIVAELREVWNATTTHPLPKWREGREKLAREALRRRPLEQWQEVFKRINASGFCRGNDGGWRADIDWALRAEGKKPETAAKVLEGAFDNRGVADNRAPVAAESVDWTGITPGEVQL